MDTEQTANAGAAGNGAAHNKSDERFVPAWQLAARDFPPEQPLVAEWLHPEEIALLIARQKEGKSTIALQLWLDIAFGDKFLGQFPTQKTKVMYVDYENKPVRLSKRLRDAARRRDLSKADCLIRAYDRLHERDVDLSQQFPRLLDAVRQEQPGLFVIDPLRLAMPKAGSSQDETIARDIIEKCSQLQACAPGLSILIVHHLKKSQENGFSERLKDNPHAWIENIYGSQALIAHVDSIWGLEACGIGGTYTFASVSRSFDERIITLSKEPDSERFIYVPPDIAGAFTTPEQRELWDRLPDEFGVQDMIKDRKVSRNLLYTVIKRARAVRLLTQDPKTKRYRKVKKEGPE
jgi:hypothetical protein